MRKGIAAAAALMFGIQAWSSGANIQQAITATMDNGTVKTKGSFTGATWYEQGLVGSLAGSGLPAGAGTVPGMSDPASTFLFAPYSGNNVLLLDSATKTGTLTLTTPTPAESIAFAGATGNGSSTLTATVHFSDGTPDATAAPLTGTGLKSGDWFNGAAPWVAVTKGRIDVGTGKYDTQPSITTPAPGNPRVYEIQGNLGLTAPHPISSIDLSFAGTGHSVIFGVSTSTSPFNATTSGPYTAAQLTAGSYNQDVVVDANSTIPEPTTLGLLGIGAFGLLARRRHA